LAGVFTILAAGIPGDADRRLTIGAQGSVAHVTQRSHGNANALVLVIERGWGKVGVIHGRWTGEGEMKAGLLCPIITLPHALRRWLACEMGT
jgi:hypothetical protein